MAVTHVDNRVDEHSGVEKRSRTANMTDRWCRVPPTNGAKVHDDKAGEHLRLEFGVKEKSRVERFYTKR